MIFSEGDRATQRKFINFKPHLSREKVIVILSSHPRDFNWTVALRVTRGYFSHFSHRGDESKYSIQYTLYQLLQFVSKLWGPSHHSQAGS